MNADGQFQFATENTEDTEDTEIKARYYLLVLHGELINSSYRATFAEK